MPDSDGSGLSVTVLVADDNEVAQRLCRRVLEKAGHRVLTASDGLEAVIAAEALAAGVAAPEGSSHLNRTD